MMRTVAAWALALILTSIAFGVASPAFAQQDPQQTIQVQQQMIQRANVCQDALVGVLELQRRLAEAQQQIDALKKQAEPKK